MFVFTYQVLNISNVANWLGEKLEDRDGFIPKTMLSVPIFNGARDVIGVAQLINKVRVVERSNDQRIFFTVISLKIAILS